MRMKGWHTYKKVFLKVKISALNGTPTTATFDLKIRTKISREDTDWFDISGKAIPQVTGSSSLPLTYVIHLTDKHLFSENIEIDYDIAFSGGSSPSWSVDMEWTGEV